jgi:hypothetical protein
MLLRKGCQPSLPNDFDVALEEVSQTAAGFESQIVTLAPMRYRRIISSALSIAFLLSSAHCQTGDWQVVQDLPSGSYISVKTKFHSFKCTFEHASDAELFCEEQRVDRERIREIRLEHRIASRVLGAVVGTAVGVGAGAAWTTHSDDPETRLFIPYLAIGGGILFAILMGRISPLHGKVLYRR